ncbi:MAG: 4Fe-4S binding protein [Clostridia bacterium]|nr:4Fe-4S binding protein [Clostridia bacterium]MBQ4366225.1 4Fe-4S binding protein [Clostridia bacterium]MBR3096144.1 4Fe-4S binding protein [Clostridia bacterium]
MAFRIDESRCVGCGGCAFTCLFDAISPVNDDASLYAIDDAKCVECSQCSHVCPNGAISAPAGWKKIKRVFIVPEKCKGCSLCSRVCKAKAPFGKIKEPFEINQDKCFRCGLCASKCKFEAIEVEYE